MIEKSVSPKYIVIHTNARYKTTYHSNMEYIMYVIVYVHVCTTVDTHVQCTYIHVHICTAKIHTHEHSVYI